MSQALAILPSLPPALAQGSPDLLRGVLEFFAAEIRNANTRRAYVNAIEDFFAYASSLPGGDRLDTITPIHIASWLEHMGRVGLSVPTQKQRLAAVKRIFQSLTAQQIIRINPAPAVRGPKFSARTGKTPVLTPDETRQLLASIDCSSLIGLRDRAVIGAMVYTFARIGAITQIRVEDVFIQNRRLWIRLKEKGGKSHAMPCHHTLEAYLTEYMEAAGLSLQPKAYLFQTLTRELRSSQGSGPPSGKPLIQQIAWSMLQRRARQAGLDTAICNHTFRATGITAYLQNGGTIERAAHMANHASTRTTQLYDRRPDDITLDEIEKIAI